jgi:hypothetical protein
MAADPRFQLRVVSSDGNESAAWGLGRGETTVRNPEFQFSFGCLVPNCAIFENSKSCSG